MYRPRTGIVHKIANQPNVHIYFPRLVMPIFILIQKTDKKGQLYFSWEVFDRDKGE